jgi:hypothetical protein
MSEGPVNFGKPLLWLVIIGCAGGGYYAATHWPYSYEGEGWNVKFPHGWEAGPAHDASDPTKIFGKGPLPKGDLPDEQAGVAWAKIVYHGTLEWTSFMRTHVPGTTDSIEDIDVDYKKAQKFTYEDQNTRYLGIAVDRGDAMVFCAIGCAKDLFPQYKMIFDKTVMSVRCQR